MRYITTVAMLAAMVTAALAQDPNRNRMNDQFPEVGPPSAQANSPSMYGNRLNVRYRESAFAEVTGGPSQYGNRMNFQWPKAESKVQPKEVERVRIDP